VRRDGEREGQRTRSRSSGMTRDNSAPQHATNSSGSMSPALFTCGFEKEGVRWRAQDGGLGGGNLETLGALGPRGVGLRMGIYLLRHGAAAVAQRQQQDLIGLLHWRVGVRAAVCWLGNSNKAARGSGAACRARRVPTMKGAQSKQREVRRPTRRARRLPPRYRGVVRPYDARSVRRGDGVGGSVVNARRRALKPALGRRVTVHG